MRKIRGVTLVMRGAEVGAIEEEAIAGEREREAAKEKCV